MVHGVLQFLVGTSLHQDFCHCRWVTGIAGAIAHCHMLGRECPEAVLPDRALYLPSSVTS